ncbi:hypothetical protein [Paenibacillus sp. 32O-W]|uniref:hypothetical protein n=1 Tax=Paenibacillus sp. 32O-W TaxID=1695218 RepID=UPI0011A754AD|nr:hypothetical protein [Paenibacillus sp. 32O-W]
MDGKFAIRLDGQEATLIVNALLEKALRIKHVDDLSYHYHTILADRISEARSEFHSRTYREMADRYGLFEDFR